MKLPPGKIPIDILKDVVFKNLGATRKRSRLGPARRSGRRSLRLWKQKRHRFHGSHHGRSGTHRLGSHKRKRQRRRHLRRGTSVFLLLHHAPRERRQQNRRNHQHPNAQRRKRLGHSHRGRTLRIHPWLS